MKLADKRRVIEALLIASEDINNVRLETAAEHVEVDMRKIYRFLYPSYDRWPVARMSFSDRMANTAYRLIESSATLRREWFGLARVGAPT